MHRVLLNSQMSPRLISQTLGRKVGGIYLVTINLPGWTSKTCTKERDYHGFRYALIKTSIDISLAGNCSIIRYRLLKSFSNIFFPLYILYIFRLCGIICPKISIQKFFWKNNSIIHTYVLVEC